MKKSMLALFSCALVAGSVMAATVDGNNTAVVIKKTPIATPNNYQLLIVPVKGFDIAKGPEAKSIALKELLPPSSSSYPTGTVVYAAAGDDKNRYVVVEIGGSKVWADEDTPTIEAKNATYDPRTPFWLQTNGKVTDPTIFCGELLDEDVTITPKAGEMQLFGNATSNEILISRIACGEADGEFDSGDTIFALNGTSDYEQYIYSTTARSWTKRVPDVVQMQPVGASDVFPAGAAAYFYRKAKN
jgi:hypothetical protein